MHSPQIATQLVNRVSAALQENTFEVFLNNDGELRWKGLDNGQQVVVDHEPQTSFWHRFNAGFLRIAPNSQLQERLAGATCGSGSLPVLPVALRI